MQTLTDAIARRLSQVELGAEVASVSPGGNRHVVNISGASGPRQLSARAVVLATPAYAAAQLVRPFSPDAAAALTEIQYQPVAVVICACA